MKIFYVVAAIIFIAIMSFFFRQWQDEKQKDFNRQYKLSFCGDENLQKMNCEKCVKNGKVIPHSFSNTCEIEAKDVGKKCTFDDECNKNNCVYQDEKATSGYCDGYIGDNDGVRNCHFPRKSNKVQCDFTMS